MHDFTSVAEAEASLRAMAERELVVLGERQPGQKEQRWRQLVAEQAEIASHPAPVASSSTPGLAERVSELEARVVRLEAALADLL
jgi:uncharacterized protein YceH (UPF0502 family)